MRTTRPFEVVNPTHPRLRREVKRLLGSESAVVSVTTAARWVEIETTARWGSTIRIRLPRPVRRFIEGFDRGRYPTLTDQRRSEMEHRAL